MTGWRRRPAHRLAHHARHERRRRSHSIEERPAELLTVLCAGIHPIDARVPFRCIGLIEPSRDCQHGLHRNQESCNPETMQTQAKWRAAGLSLVAWPTGRTASTRRPAGDSLWGSRARAGIRPRVPRESVERPPGAPTFSWLRCEPRARRRERSGRSSRSAFQRRRWPGRCDPGPRS